MAEHPVNRAGGQRLKFKQRRKNGTAYQEEGRRSGEAERERLRRCEEELREREREPPLLQQNGLLGERSREEGGETEPREGEQLEGGEQEGEPGGQSKSRSRGVPSHG